MVVISYNENNFGKEIKYNDEDVRDHDAVLAIIKNKKGEILMQEHLKYGFWTIPGGKAKKEHDIISALKQEIFEECGVSIKECREIISDKRNYTRGDKKVHVIQHIFEVISYSGKVENKEPEKHSAQKFFSIDKIINLPYLSDVTLLYLEKIGLKREARI